MLPTLHENEVNFRTAIRKTAQHYSINPAMVEKDYWVTWCIHYLFEQSPWKASLGFKGGTCMAKAYDVISRFSEDVDVLLDWRLLGYRTYEPYEPSTPTAQNKMKKRMDKSTQEYLADTMLPAIQADVRHLLGDSFKVSIEDDDVMSIHFYYPAKFTPDAALLPTVKLEIGPLSQWSEMTQQPITSMIDQALPGLNIFNPMQILCVTPERTFWDKISILQNISHLRDKNPDKPMAPRQSRHYYDVYRILQSGYKESCLEQINLLFDTMAFSNRFYPVKTFDYRDVTLTNIQLTVPDSLIPSVKADYESMKGMLYGDKPSFETIYKAILEFQNDLHNLGRTLDPQQYSPFDSTVKSAQHRHDMQPTHPSSGEEHELKLDDH